MGFLHFHSFLLFLSCLLALVAGERIHSLEQKWVSLIPNQEGKYENTIIWPENTRHNVVGMAIAQEELWTFTFTKEELREAQRSVPDEPNLYYQESNVFQEDFSQPLFENDEWSRHASKFEAAIILSYDYREGAAFRGLVGALAEEMKKKTGVDKVEWKEVAAGKSTELLLTSFKNANVHRIMISRGQSKKYPTAILSGSTTTQGRWQRDDLPSADLKTPDWGKKEPVTSLMIVQRICDVQTTDPRSALPYDRSKWEPTAQLIQFKWPGANGQLPRALYHNDDSINSNDIAIMITTTESAWIVMLPDTLVLSAVDDLNLHTEHETRQLRADSWYRKNIGNKVQDLWEEVLRRCDDDFDAADVNDPALIHGKFTGMVILSRGFEGRHDKGLRNEELIRAVLSDLWVVSDHPTQAVKGPLRGRDPIQVPYFSFEAQDRLRPGSKFDKRVLAPEHYLAIETKGQLGSRGKQGSLFHLYYGRQVVFSGAFARTWQGNEPVKDRDYYLSSPKGDRLGSIEFHPPPPEDPDEMDMTD